MFGKLFGKSKEKPVSSGSAALSKSVETSILNFVGAKSVQTMPGAAQKAFKLSTDPKAEARDFIDVIESDEALSARVIKIANSVFFDRGKQSQTIEESVIVIGINELRSLLSATTLSDIFPTKHPARMQLWSNDVATALIAKSLAERVLPSKTDIAFLGGLMHDIGKLLLLQRASDTYEKVMRTVATQGVDFHIAEAECFIFDHCEVGQLIGDKWNFTPELKSILRDHHQSWEELERNPNKTLIAIVKTADICAHAIGLGHPANFHKFRSNCSDKVDGALEFLKISPSEKKDLLSKYQKTFELEFDLYSGKLSK